MPLPRISGLLRSFVGLAVCSTALSAQTLPFGSWTNSDPAEPTGLAAELRIGTDASGFALLDATSGIQQFVVRDGNMPVFFLPDGNALLMQRPGQNYRLLDLQSGNGSVATPPLFAAEIFVNASSKTLLTVTAEPDLNSSTRLRLQRFPLDGGQGPTDLGVIEPVELPLLELHRTLPGRRPDQALLVLRDLELTGDPYDPRRWGDYQFVELDLNTGRTTRLSTLESTPADLFLQSNLHWTSTARQLLNAASYPDYDYLLIDPYAGKIVRSLKVPNVQFNTETAGVVTAIRSVEENGATQLYRDYLEPGTLKTLRNVPIASADDFPENPEPPAHAADEAPADAPALSLHRFGGFAFHPSEPEFFAHDYDGNVTFFRFTASGLKRQTRGSAATTILYAPDGQSLLATEYSEGPIRSVPAATFPYDADAGYDYPNLQNTLPEYDYGYTVSPSKTFFISQTSTLSTLYRFGQQAIAAELMRSPRDRPDFYAFSPDEALLARLTRDVGYDENTGEDNNYAEISVDQIDKLLLQEWPTTAWSRPLDHGAYALATLRDQSEAVLLNLASASLEFYADADTKPRSVPIAELSPDELDPLYPKVFFDLATNQLFAGTRFGLAAIDLAADEPTATRIALDSPVSRFHRLGDQRHLVLELESGALVFLETSAPVPAIAATLELYNFGREYVLRTPGGRFDATPLAQNEGFLLQGYRPIRLTQIFNQAYDPELFTRLFSGLPADTAPLADVVRPPTVTLDAGWINALRYKLRLQAESTVQDIAELRLYQNDKLVHTAPPSWARGAGIDLEIDLVLEPENRFRLIAVTTEGVESLPAELVLRPPEAELRRATAIQRPAELHLLVVGVNQYRNPEYNLNFAVPDATAILAKLDAANRPLFAKINTHRLADAESTHDGILAAFDAVKRAAQPHDAFLFYFAGHGVMSKTDQKFYLIPHDVTRIYGDSQSLTENGLSADTLRQLSAAIVAQKQLFILDACNSGGAIQAFAQRGASQEKALAQLARATGTHWITASSANQFATEFAELGHGAFTHTLLRALDGAADTGDKRVTINELKAFLESELPAVTQRHKGAPQYPSSYGYGQDFPVALLP